MPPESNTPRLEHDEEMYQKHGEGLSKDQHLVVYSLAYQHGHSAGYGEVEQYYAEFAEFALQLLDADAD
jgi:hypothetical protein